MRATLSLVLDNRTTSTVQARGHQSAFDRKIMA